MSVDTAVLAPPPVLLEASSSILQHQANPSRQNVLNVWTAPSLEQSQIIAQDYHHGNDDDNDSQYDSRKPSTVSSMDNIQEEEQLKTKETSYFYKNGRSLVTGEREHQQAFLAAVKLLDGIKEDNKRKTSDPVMSKRSEIKLKKRCLSDSTGSNPVVAAAPIADDTSSAVGGDSGIVDCQSHCSNKYKPDTKPERSRKSIPALSNTLRTGSLDEGTFRKLQQDDDNSSHSGSTQTKQRRGRLTKHLSLGSVGGSSDTISFHSLFEVVSPHSMATDILSGLGFGDFDSPQLIPDRFIPAELDTAKPSVMFEHILMDVYSPPGAPVSEPPITQYMTSSVADVQEFDLPLGATADNFISTKSFKQSPPPSSPPPQPAPPTTLPLSSMSDPSFSVYNRKYVQLEPVPEETASDLSPSPRWMSPRVSLDHSYLDLSTGQLGTSLNVANRKRSLPNREGYRMSMESLLSEQDSTVYFSITSYDDDLAKEESKLTLPVEDATRQRRRGVHHAPPELLSWLEHQKIPEVDDDELPWPFNEQAKIRRSLTEYQQQQRLSRSSSSTLDDRSLSPPCDDPLEGVFPRRFSINGPLTAPNDLFNEMRRLSLPSTSSYNHYRNRLSPAPPSLMESIKEPTIEEEEFERSSDGELENEVEMKPNTRLPPGMTREDALGYKRNTIALKAELDTTQKKLRDVERVRRNEEEDHKRKLSDTEEWLRSELWMKERQCHELEEGLDNMKRDYRLLQQNQQILIARTKEEVRDAKDKEILDLKHKMDQKIAEYREKVTKLEEECRHLRTKENQLMKKTNQQGLKTENEELHRELAHVKEQLRHEKQIIAATGRDKAMEIKQLRTKAQLEKEEALKNQKEHLTKVHQSELTSLRQMVQHTSGESFGKVRINVTPSTTGSPNKLEMKKLHYQMDRMDGELRRKQEETDELKLQLEILHKEHLLLEKEMAQKLKTSS